MASVPLKDLRAPVATELEEFHRYFKGALSTNVGLLDRVLKYMLRRKGKQMRPLFVLLSARLVGEITPKTYRAAALIELLHTATLVHDDVVDDADRRRGLFSLNALWKNKISVLVGDFLLSRGLLVALEHNDYELLQLTSTAVKLMAEGELLQIEKARRLDVDEPVYFDIIRMKTASLIAACCATGAASATDDDTVIEQLRAFGETVGLAFQIRDDLFDFGAVTGTSAQQTGKPTGIDVQEQKITLPLIHVLNRASGTERRRLINTVKRHNTDPKHVRWLMDYVHANGGITYAQAKMNELTEDALAQLHAFPAIPARQHLEDVVRYAIQRQQ